MRADKSVYLQWFTVLHTVCSQSPRVPRLLWERKSREEEGSQLANSGFVHIHGPSIQRLTACCLVIVFTLFILSNGKKSSNLILHSLFTGASVQPSWKDSLRVRSPFLPDQSVRL